MQYRPLLRHDRHVERLQRVFPRAAFDTVLSAPLAGAAVAAMVYVNAVVPDGDELPPDIRWARPSTCLWLSEAAFARDDPASRTAWYEAAIGAKAKERLAALHAGWGIPFRPLYGDNTRETLRDETFPAWLGHGAVARRPGMKTTSPGPRWALVASFADLFDPALQGDALENAIAGWREAHMTPQARVKAVMAQERADSEHAISVHLPNGVVRALEPGEASVILKGVVEQWAVARLADPVVLTISEPGQKVYTADGEILSRLGLKLDVSTLLPDALLVDLGSPSPVFWMVEAVATDGAIDEPRKRALLRWATEQHIPDNACEFLTAFSSRMSAPARRRLKDLAAGTYAWYADEPEYELSWTDLNPPTVLRTVRRLSPQ